MALFKIEDSKKIALCLGGGGARGFAHIGALKAFEEAGIEFDTVAGTSVGSLIGGLYAAGVPIEKMMNFGNELNLKNVRSGFAPNDPSKIGNIVKELVGSVRIEDLKKKLYIIAVDLVEAKQVIMERGLLYEAVSASCAVPIFFKPLVKGRMHLVDGGLLNNIPADVLRMVGADYVVTVDINPTRGGGTEGLGIMDIAKATLSIMSAVASNTGLINSDIIIAPDMSKFSASKKDGHEEMVELGYNATKEKIAEIKALFGRKKEAVIEQTPQKSRLEKRREKKEQKIALKQEKAAAKRQGKE